MKQIEFKKPIDKNYNIGDSFKVVELPKGSDKDFVSRVVGKVFSVKAVYDSFVTCGISGTPQSFDYRHIRRTKKAGIVFLKDSAYAFFKNLNSTYGRSVCGWGFINVNGRFNTKNASSLCYAGIKSPVPIVLAGVVSQPFFPKKNKERRYEEHTAYLDYILNRSPWKDCFLQFDENNKTVFAENYGIVLNIDKSIDHLVGGMVAIREANEFPESIALFLELKNRGVDEHIAFIISKTLRIKENKEVVVRGIDDCHKVLHPLHAVPDLFLFFKTGVFATDGRKSFRDFPNQSYSRISKHIAKVCSIGDVNTLANFNTDYLKLPQKPSNGSFFKIESPTYSIEEVTKQALSLEL